MCPQKFVHNFSSVTMEYKTKYLLIVAVVWSVRIKSYYADPTTEVAVTDALGAEDSTNIRKKCVCFTTVVVVVVGLSLYSNTG